MIFGDDFIYVNSKENRAKLIKGVRVFQFWNESLVRRGSSRGPIFSHSS